MDITPKYNICPVHLSTFGVQMSSDMSTFGVHILGMSTLKKKLGYWGVRVAERPTQTSEIFTVTVILTLSKQIRLRKSQSYLFIILLALADTVCTIVSIFSNIFIFFSWSNDCIFAASNLYPNISISSVIEPSTLFKLAKPASRCSLVILTFFFWDVVLPRPYKSLMISGIGSPFIRRFITSF